MAEPEEMAVCGGCGAVAPRSEMFGVPPDFRCQACADGIRARYDTRLLVTRKTRPPVVTSLVVATAIALFVVVHVLKKGDPWVLWLLAREGIWDGEVWRLVTSAFLHAGPAFGFSMPMGLLHVGFNVWFCWDLGRAIEGRWGSFALLGLVIGGAAVSSAAQWAVSGPGVGLSGVMYGLAGYLFALRKVDAVAATVMNPRTANSLIMWFVLCIVMTMTGSWRVANWAHGGGAVWGWLVGLAVLVPWRRLAIPLAVAVTIALVAATPYVVFGKQAEWRREYKEWQSRR